MDFITFFSLFLYVGTFFMGFLLDRRPEKKKKARKIFVGWLYVFLCFGYMCGSDWDMYEPAYTDGYGVYRFITEPISYFLFTVFPKFMPDFWLFCGLAKCIYLFTLIMLLKSLTPRWLSALSLMMPFSLLFMLISNPFRYMLGLCFINIALLWIVNDISGEKKVRLLWWKVGGLVFLSTLTQNTCAVFFILLPIILFYKKIYNANKVVLFICFLIVIFITSDISLFGNLKMTLNNFVTSRFGFRDYISYYEYETNASLFSLGNLFKIFFLFVVLYYRDAVTQRFENGKLLYSVAVLSLFLGRFFLLIPTAFRWAIPFDYFCVVYFICCLQAKQIYVKVIVLYATFLLCKNLWFSYDLIPYSNSIPYILTEHKSYAERLYYNTEAYNKRTGSDRDVNVQNL